MLHKSRSKILVIDTGLGNMGSLISALNFLDFEISIINSFHQKEKLNVDGFILPGVGTFPIGMKKLKDNNLDILIHKLIEREIPGIGICLGMQLFAEFGFECNATTKGLNLFRGNVELMKQTKNAKVPHIGWTQTCLIKNDEDWQKHLNNAFYYIHSYSFISRNKDNVLATIDREGKKIIAAIYRKKLLGLQFHPEKSQINGLFLIRDYFNFHIK